MREPAPFEELAPDASPVPVIVHVPHAGTRIPDRVRQGLLVDDARLSAELLALTDHRTDVLSAGVGQVGATRFVNRLSRLVVDPERLPDDREELAARGMGAVYTHGHRREPLRELSDEDRELLLARYFHPYTHAFAALVASHLDVHGCCTIVDVHSFSSRRLPYELHDGRRPAVCVGTDDDHTPPWLVRLVTGVADEHGLQWACNTPFAGTYVPLERYGTDRRVTSVMLELRRDGYLDEATATPHGGEPAMAAFVTAVVAAIADRL